MPVLTESIDLLGAAVRHSFNSVVITDAEIESGGPFIVHCNPAFRAMTGYALEELIGRSPRMLQGPETDRALMREARRCMAEGRYFEGQTVNYRKDGTRYVVRWNLIPIYDRWGEISHFVSVQQDLTSRVEAQRERDLLLTALNASADAIVVAGLDDRIEYANAGFGRLTGWDPEVVVGQPLALLQPSFEAGADWRADLAGGRSCHRRVSWRCRDGHRVTLEETLTPVADACGRTTRYVCTAREVG